METGAPMNFFWGSLRCFLGGLFLYAGAVKAWDPTQFYIDIDHYRILPSLGVFLTAIYLPWVEVICGICLICKYFYSGAIVVLMALMGLFVAALGSAWIRGLDIRCGCFGGSSGMSNDPIWIGRDFLIFSALVLLYLKRGRIQGLASNK